MGGCRADAITERVRDRNRFQQPLCEQFGGSSSTCRYRATASRIFPAATSSPTNALTIRQLLKSEPSYATLSAATPIPTRKKIPFLLPQTEEKWCSSRTRSAMCARPRIRNSNNRGRVGPPARRVRLQEAGASLSLIGPWRSCHEVRERPLARGQILRRGSRIPRERGKQNAKRIRIELSAIKKQEPNG